MMRTQKSIGPLRLFLWMLIPVMVGCLGPAAPVHFYALSPLEGEPLSGVATAFPQDLIIGIGPVEIPEMYNRPQIVTKISENQMEISEYHRWAGSLQEEITAVVTENLSRLLRSDRIIPFPWDSVPKPEIKVAVSINRFDGILGKEAIFMANYSISTHRKKTNPIVKKTVLKAPMADSTYQAYVTAKSRVLADFSRELASEVIKLNVTGNK